jgi:hypothetical protein
MNSSHIRCGILAIAAAALLAGCGSRDGRIATPTEVDPNDGFSSRDRDFTKGTSVFDAFKPKKTEVTVAVNKYLWTASLEVLDFLPVESVDPFTGVIVTGFGTPPGGGRAYRATVLVSDPALDARSLNVSIQSRNGPASAPTIRAIEDAILSRARQLRIADNKR